MYFENFSFEFIFGQAELNRSFGSIFMIMRIIGASIVVFSLACGVFVSLISSQVLPLRLKIRIQTSSLTIGIQSKKVWKDENKKRIRAAVTLQTLPQR